MRSSLGAGAIGAIVALVIVAFFTLGVFSFNWPWSPGELTSTEKEVVAVEEAEIFEIQAVALDCRARIFAEIPVTGTKEHRALGQVYRTDKVELEAVGDVDTCLDANEVQITMADDGSFDVYIPAEAIRFERPRIELFKTRDSITYDQGLIGKVTDVFPWVSDTEGLTGGALAYAQGVIGGSECMRAAYEVTERLIIDAYRDQLEEADRSVLDVRVRIDGEPDFWQNDVTGIEGFEMEVTGGAGCTVAPEALTGVRLQAADA